MTGFRTVVINKRCKLESMLGSLVIRSLTEERIHLGEIETLIIESTAVAVTSALIVDLTEAGVNIMFCDRRHLPTAIFTPVHSHFGTAKNIKVQIEWTNERKAQCWRQVIREKIRQQSLHLAKQNMIVEHDLLLAYRSAVSDGDIDNCEAHAAAAYFRALFGGHFSRNGACAQNNALNYGYTLVLSAFAREISACGYLTELGIWHRGTENPFNLASDLMEPFRVAVDKLVVAFPENMNEEYKHYMLRLMCSRIKINGENQSFVPAIRIYLHRIFRFMCAEVDDIFEIEILDGEE